MAELIDIQIPADQQEGTESVVAGWLRQPGDFIEAHEPIAEISTDKAIVEIAAPCSGILREILKQTEEAVTPGTVIGRIEPSEAGTEVHSPAAKQEPSAPKPVATRAAETRGSTSGIRMSPAVKRLVQKHGLDPAQITGTGHAGRITKVDVMQLLGSTEPKSSSPAPSYDTSGIPSRSVPHDIMRKKIANHMSHSLLHTAPHVTAVFDCDLTAIIAHRKENKPEFEAKQVKLTYTAYFVRAAVEALKAVPEVNSRWHDDRLEVFEDQNIGVGTALKEKGLVVPVLSNAQDLDLFETAAKLQELTDKARNGRLTPVEMQNGTFTISNHGVSGTLFAAPIIINQPQSAILGIGKLEKRPIVQEVDGKENIEIRARSYVSLTIDHRVLDAYHTNSFLTKFVDTLENWK